MFKHLLTRHRRQPPRNPADRRTTARVPREPEPMPRMRWY